MAPKRVKSGRTGSAAVARSKEWEEPLKSSVLHEECWSVCVSLVVCDSVYDEVYMRALCHAVQQPLRRLFSLVSWENLLQKVHDLGNPKTRKIKELPAYYEVTEVVRSVLDSGDELSVDLLAKLIKFRLLEIKNSDIQRRAAEQKTAGSVTPVGEKSSQVSGKGSKGKKAPPPRVETKLKRRGEETCNYIDDEPDDGPQHYVLMTGFHQPSLISALDSIGVHVSNVIRLKSDSSQISHVAQEEGNTETTEEQELSVGVRELQQDLSVFWDQLDGVLNSAGFQSRLSDVARLDYTVGQNLLSRDLTKSAEMQEVGVAIFEGMACLVYDCLDWRRQHEHYLNTMRLINIPNIYTPVHNIPPDAPTEVLSVRMKSEERSDVDMRLYTDLLDRIPLHCVSVPLILHCLLEQVVLSEQEVSGGSDGRSDPERDLIFYMMGSVKPQCEQECSELMEHFGLNGDNGESKDRSPALLHHHDERSKRLYNIPVLEGLDAVSAEECMMKKSCVFNTLMSKHTNTNNLHTARRHELLYHCSTDSLSSADAQRFLQLCVFESMPLTTVDECSIHMLLTPHTVLPWDDPMTFTHSVYCVKDTTHESTVPGDKQQEIQFSLEDLQKTLIRHFRHWNFTEHHNVDIFSQVLQTACEKYRCVDSYHSSQSNIVYVFCHNPMSPERSSRASWEVSLHSDVRFRTYLDNVAESIKDWVRAEEKRLQQQHQQQQHQKTETPDTTTEGVSPLPKKVFVGEDSLKVFTGYRMDGRLVQVRGESQCVYPSDGGQICVEKVHYVQGSTNLKVCVRKDEHRFYTHLTEPERQKIQDKKYGCFYAVLSNGLTLAYSHTHQEDDDMSPLQLHVSLPTGLQIHFSFQRTAHEQALLVHQSLPSSGSKLPNTHTESSRTITCDGTVIRHMRDGSAVVLFADSTVSVSSDAGPVCVSIPRSTGEHKNTSTHTESTDTDVKPSSDVGAEEAEPISKVELKQQVEMTGGSWCTTTPSGVRIRTIRGERVEENPVLTFYSTDPHTHSVMMTRDDGVMCVSGKHKVAVDHADGTRMISSFQQRETQSLQNSGSSDGGRRSRVKVEKSGFATVIMNCEEKSGKVLFRDGTTISATAHGSYRVSLPDGGCLSVCKDGVAVYSSTGPEGEQRGRYIMSHSNGLVCELTDSDGNNYQVTAEGRVSITHTHTDTETQHNTCLSTHPPRLFMVYADGSAVEFLSSQTVDKILQKNTHPSVAVIREAIPHTHDAFEITILKPFSDLSSYWLSPTHLDDIIPANLRSRRWDTFPSSEVKTRGTPFGMSLGRDLELKNRTTRGSDPTPPLLQNPKTLVIRRIIEHTPFTQQQQQHLQHNLLLYINKLLQREKLKDEMKLKDPETVLEKLHITDLHLLQSHSDSSADTPSPLSMHSLYSQAVGVSDSPLSNQHDDQHGIHSKQQRKSEWENRIHQHRLELQEESRHRSALRNRIIMQYFQPEVQDLIRSIQQKPRLTTSSPTLPSLPKRRDAGLQNFSSSM